MPQLNAQATILIANALHDAADLYEKLSGDPEVPARLRLEFSEQLHMARTLKELFETENVVDLPTTDAAEYKALIWAW